MFHILKKCSGKFDCLLYKMFLIRKHKAWELQSYKVTTDTSWALTGSPRSSNPVWNHKEEERDKKNELLVCS